MTTTGASSLDPSVEDRQAHLKTWYSTLGIQGARFVLITGAGISETAGFPTFQGFSENGIKAYDLLNWNTVVERQTQPHLNMFLSFVAQMREKSLRTDFPTPFHKWAQNHKHLDLWLSFNVDGLEKKAVPSQPGSRGQKTSKVVLGHGDLEHLRCNACRQTIPFGEFEVSTLLREQRIPHQHCPSQSKRNANKQCWFRPTMLLYGSDPDIHLHPNCQKAIVNTLTRFAQRKSKQKKLVLVLAGLSLQQQELRSFITSVAQWVAATEGGEIIWVNPKDPYSCLKPYITHVTRLTADQFAQAVSTS